jgi:hypothetical protein
MPNESKSSRFILLAGLLVILVWALFPPRRSSHPQYSQPTSRGGVAGAVRIPRAFLLSADFPVGKTSDGQVLRAEVDGGQLLAELTVIGAATAIAYVWMSRRAAP